VRPGVGVFLLLVATTGCGASEPMRPPAPAQAARTAPPQRLPAEDPAPRFIPTTIAGDGEASVTACIEVLFFSECVNFTVKREIEGPGGSHDAPRFGDQPFDADRPRAAGVGFGDLVDLTAWTEYCNAFA